MNLWVEIELEAIIESYTSDCLKISEMEFTGRIYFYLWDYTIRWWGYREWLHYIPYHYEKMTEKTLKKIVQTKNFKTYVLKYLPYSYPRVYAINNLIRACEDWSISDRWLIEELRDIISENEIVKLSHEGKKYYNQLSNKED